MSFPLIRPALAIAATIGLGACSSAGYDGYYGNRVAVGYGAGYYQPYYGWYDDYYYPGTGYYVWDRSGYRHNWSDRQRRYWMDRRAGHRAVRDNWHGYNYTRRGDYVHRDQRRYRDQRRDEVTREQRQARGRGSWIERARAAAEREKRAEQRDERRGDRRRHDRRGDD